MPHCYYCEEEAQDIIHYHAYTNSTQLGERIYPLRETDMSSVYVEPITGAAVIAVLKLQTNFRYMRDYFFRNLYETKKNQGLYIPIYVNNQSFNLTDNQVQTSFGTLMMTQQIKAILPYIGYTVGPLLILAGIILGFLFWRMHKNAGLLNEVPQFDDANDAAIN
jgi:hypothetical protein